MNHNGIHLSIIMSAGKNKTPTSCRTFRGTLKPLCLMIRTLTLVIPNAKKLF